MGMEKSLFEGLNIRYLETENGRAGYAILKGIVRGPIYGASNSVEFRLEGSHVERLVIYAHPPLLPGDDVQAAIPLFMMHKPEYPQSLILMEKPIDPKREKVEMMTLKRGIEFIGFYSNSHMWQKASSRYWMVEHMRRVEELLQKESEHGIGNLF